jgi:hypothetical protein
MGKLSENPGPGNYIIPGLFGVDNSKVFIFIIIIKLLSYYYHIIIILLS